MITLSMPLIIDLSIFIFGAASYFLGLRSVVNGTYRPNTFSRIIWMLLAINTTAAVIMSGATPASLALSIVFLVGNIAMCIASLWKGKSVIGPLEITCTLLLLVSLVLWFTTNIPILNLVLGLFAHFIGALPTFKQAWKDGESENTAFWLFFFLASVFSLVGSINAPVKTIIFPFYFVVFDGIMTLLSIRKTRPISKPQQNG